MADQLYLSLWFSNFRLESLPSALVSVLNQVAAAGGSFGVHAATTYPISWNEAPAYQRIYSREEVEAATPRLAVADATESLHDDFAYEFETAWDLWIAETAANLDPTWRKEPRAVRVTGFGPHFDQETYEQSGHIQVDLGTDTPFLEDEVDLDSAGKRCVQQNLQKLVNFIHAVEKNCSISSRVLWCESGDNLAQKLVARLQRVN